MWGLGQRAFGFPSRLGGWVTAPVHEVVVHHFSLLLRPAALAAEHLLDLEQRVLRVVVVRLASDSGEAGREVTGSEGPALDALHAP